MQLSLEMQHKLAHMAAGLHLRNRDEPKPKPKTLYLARMNVRSDAVGGGAVPEDEVQIDFCISTDKRDNHFSYMTEKTLRNYGEDAAGGLPFVRDHQESMETQIGRVIAGEYDESAKRVTATISMLRDSDDTPDNLKVNEYIRRIERGYYTDCSVQFRGGKEICRLDGKEIWDWQRDDPCPHIPGRTYNSKECEYDVDDARLRHVALVANGSNQQAKSILDRSTWDENLRRIKEDGLAAAGDNGSDPKTLLERDGLKWRETLITTALAEGVRAEDDFDQEAWKARLEKNDSDTILAQTDTWRKLGNARWGEGGRKTDGGQPTGSTNNEQVLILPSYLFRADY